MTIKKYPYTKKNLFEAPENYQYADCSDCNYLDLWKRDRLEKLELLQKYYREASFSSSNQMPKEEITIQSENGDISTLKFFSDVLLTLQRGDSFGKEIDVKIDGFLRKYEVFKKLYSLYDENNKKCQHAQPASLDVYITFAKLLLEIYKKCGNTKFLSTFLKLIDALTSCPLDSYDLKQTQDISNLIRSEIHFVEELIK